MIKQIHESVGLVIDYEWSDNKKICDAYYTLPSKPKFLKCRLVFDEKNYLKERTKYLNESDNSSVTTQYQYSSGKIIKEVKDGVITKENLYAEDALYKTILYKDGMQLSYTTFQKLDNQTTQQIIYHDSTAVSMMIEYTDEKIQKIDNYSFDQEKNLTLTRTTTTSYDTLGNVASIEMAAKDVVSKTDYKYY